MTVEDKAIQAERERCALLAERVTSNVIAGIFAFGLFTEDDPAPASMLALGDVIAQAIRRGDAPDDVPHGAQAFNKH